MDAEIASQLLSDAGQIQRAKALCVLEERKKLLKDSKPLCSGGVVRSGKEAVKSRTKEKNAWETSSRLCFS